MKKILVLAFASMLFAACSGGSVKDQYIGLIEDATEAINDAKTAEEIKAVGEEHGEKIDAFEREHRQECNELANDEDVKKALQDFLQATFAKALSVKE